MRLDKGGYFILKGKERVLVGQLRGIYNQPIVLSQKPDDKYKFVCEVRSMSEETGHSVLIQAKIGNKMTALSSSMFHISKNVSLLASSSKHLVLTTDEQITDIIGNISKSKKMETYIKYIIRDSYFIQTQEAALKHISQFTIHSIKDDKKIEYTAQVMLHELLPHMGIFSSIAEKSVFLGHMVNKLLYTTIGLRKED